MGKGNSIGTKLSAPRKRGRWAGATPDPAPRFREAGGRSSGGGDCAGPRSRPPRRRRTRWRRAAREEGVAPGLCGRGARGGAWPAGGAPPPPGAPQPAALPAAQPARGAQATRACFSPAPSPVAAAAAPPLQVGGPKPGGPQRGGGAGCACRGRGPAWRASRRSRRDPCPAGRAAASARHDGTRCAGSACGVQSPRARTWERFSGAPGSVDSGPPGRGRRLEGSRWPHCMPGTVLGAFPYLSPVRPHVPRPRV